MVQEQSRKYELQGSKTRGGQPIILGARGNAVTSVARGNAGRRRGATATRRRRSEIFPKKEKTTEPNGEKGGTQGKTLEPKIDMHDTGGLWVPPLSPH